MAQINIAGTLHNTEEIQGDALNSHVVAHADEILDATKEKKQSEVNADVDTALADRYTKAETYNKTELDNLITTPNVQYVTVATYSDLPATGEADTIYRVASWDGSTVDAGKYSEYAWNGTAYQLLAVRSGSLDGVFDISANNLTEGQPTQYADLAAALGTNGANVPVGVRAGGMSVRFINSSTGKYEQCRYMGTDVTTNATFTNVANWQGVDETPTAGSHNLVTSGGVFLDENLIVRDIVGILPDSFFVRENVPYYDSSGQIYTNSFKKRTPPIKVKTGDIYEFTLRNNTSYLAVVAFGTDKTLLLDKSVVGEPNANNQPSTYTVPAGVDYIQFQSNYDYPYIKVTTNAKYADALPSPGSGNFVKSNGVYITNETIKASVTADKLQVMPSVTIDSDMLSSLIYNGTKIVISNNTNRSLIVKVEPSATYKTSRSVGVALFNSFPQVDAIPDSVLSSAKSFSNIGYKYALFNLLQVNDTISKANSISSEVQGISDRLNIVEQEVAPLNEYAEFKELNETSTNGKIKIWVDDAKNMQHSAYKFCATFTRPGGDEKYIIYKATESHTGLEIVVNPALSGTSYDITKDPDKPVLYLFGIGGIDGAVDPYNVNIKMYVENEESLPNQIESLNERVSVLENNATALQGKTIVVFGDSISEFKGSDNKTWCNHAEDISGATFINIGIGGTQLKSRIPRASVFDPTKTYQINEYVYYKPSTEFHFYKCITQHTGQWNDTDFTELSDDAKMYVGLDIVNLVTMACDISTPIETRFIDAEAAANCVKANMSSHDDNTAQVSRLKDVDWSDVSAIIVMGGTNDYAGNLGQVDSIDITTEYGAINTIVSQLSTSYGTIPLYFVKEPVKWFPHEEGGVTTYPDENWCDVYERNDITIAEYFKQIAEQFTTVNHIPVCDLYYMLGWNKYNFWNYFRIASDGTHPYNGFKQIAEKIVSYIIANKVF